MDRFDPLGIVGTTVDDKYRIEGVVGEGGFAIVYRARHTVWNRLVAIKCFKAPQAAAADIRDKLHEDFIREGALLSQLSEYTSGIVQARDVGEFNAPSGDRISYMNLEWLDGATLEAVLDAERTRSEGMVQTAWPIEKVISLLQPVALALDVGHKLGISHRDIKPANLFVIGTEPDDMRVKVLDFGIAKTAADTGDAAPLAGGSEYGLFTPAYAAPEQLEPYLGPTGPWTDVYALALVMVELLLGHAPFERGDVSEPGKKPNRSKRPTPASFGVAVKPALEAVFRRALAPMPDERHPTAGEFWSAVCEAQGIPSKPVGDGAVRWRPPDIASRDATTRPLGRPNATSQLPEPPPAAPLEAGLAETKVLKRPSSNAPVFYEGGVQRNLRVAVDRLSRSRLAGIVTGVVTAIGAGVCATRGAPPGPQTVGVASAASSSERSELTVVAAAACPPDMASIDGGKFFMGNDDGSADSDERPVHQVTLSPYCVDLREVTVAEYKACSESGECKRAPTEVAWKGITRAERKAFSTLCNGSRADRSDHPVNCVDWDMASAYCSWQKKRLPTEAEWEFAARGPDGRRFPWGDEAPDKDKLNACGRECLDWGEKNGVDMGVRGKGMYGARDAFVGTAPVGSFTDGKSRFGVLDLAGNVWEWTGDWEAKYASQPAVDPAGPASGVHRIVRGGAFNGALPAWVRSTQRYGDDPAARSHAYGFRCVRSR